MNQYQGPTNLFQSTRKICEPGINRRLPGISRSNGSQITDSCGHYIDSQPGGSNEANSKLCLSSCWIISDILTYIRQRIGAEQQHVGRSDEVVEHDEQQHHGASPDDAQANDAPATSHDDAEAKHDDEERHDEKARHDEARKHENTGDDEEESVASH